MKPRSKHISKIVHPKTIKNVHIIVDIYTLEELSVLNNPQHTKVIDFKTALSSFIDDCEIRNLRPQTIQYYRNELSLFYKSLREQDIDPSPLSITKDHIKENIILYMKSKGLKTVTYKCYPKNVQKLLFKNVQFGQLTA